MIRGLVAKGLVRREVDLQDARAECLYPITVADANRARIRVAWSRALDGIVDDAGTVDFINATLRTIESALIARRRASGDQGGL